MLFRSAMCPNCDNIMKIDSSSETVYCARCGSQLAAEDAFVYYDLKHADNIDINAVNSLDMLVTTGKTLLEQKKYDQADLCFQKAIEKARDDYYLWKLRAFTLESKVVNELKQSFYSYNKQTKDLIENKEYLDQYKELCQMAVRYCPSDLTEELAEEFNDRIREHFSIAMRAFNKERKRYRLVVISTALILFLIVAFGFRSCRL